MWTVDETNRVVRWVTISGPLMGLLVATVGVLRRDWGMVSMGTVLAATIGIRSRQRHRARAREFAAGQASPAGRPDDLAYDERDAAVQATSWAAAGVVGHVSLAALGLVAILRDDWFWLLSVAVALFAMSAAQLVARRRAG